MAGIAVWTFLIEDVVVAFYGLMLFIGVTAYGTDDVKNPYGLTSLICGLVGMVVVIVVVVIGFVMKKKMLWDSLS